MLDESSHRKRMRRREVPGGYRFITFSCHRRLPLLADPGVAGMLVEAMERARARLACELHAWVIMPEHVHLLLRPLGTTSIDRVLVFMKSSLAQRAIAMWMARGDPVVESIRVGEGTPRVWQKGGGFDRNIRDISEYCREVRYIHRNPVERGLVECAQAWTWSSVRWWMGFREGEVVCDPPPREISSGWSGFM